MGGKLGQFVEHECMYCAENVNEWLSQSLKERKEWNENEGELIVVVGLKTSLIALLGAFFAVIYTYRRSPSRSKCSVPTKMNNIGITCHPRSQDAPIHREYRFSGLLVKGAASGSAPSSIAQIVRQEDRQRSRETGLSAGLSGPRRH